MTDSKPSTFTAQDNPFSFHEDQLEEGTQQSSAELEQLRQDYIKTRRETIYWRRQVEEGREQAGQMQEELRRFYSSSGYRRYKLFAFIKLHRRSLIPLTIIGFICLICVPILLVLLLLPAGRRALMRLALKSATLRGLMELNSEHKSVAENNARGTAREKMPLTLRRPFSDPEEFNSLSKAQRRSLHYGQLSPQSRYKLAKLGVDAPVLKNSKMGDAVRSLDRSEISLQRVSFAVLAKSSTQE